MYIQYTIAAVVIHVKYMYVYVKPLIKDKSARFQVEEGRTIYLRIQLSNLVAPFLLL